MLKNRDRVRFPSHRQPAINKIGFLRAENVACPRVFQPPASGADDLVVCVLKVKKHSCFSHALVTGSH